MPLYRLGPLDGFITFAEKFDKKLDRLQINLTNRNSTISELTEIVSMIADEHSHMMSKSEGKNKRKTSTASKVKGRIPQLKTVRSKSPQSKPAEMNFKVETKLKDTKAPQHVPSKLKKRKVTQTKKT